MEYNRKIVLVTGSNKGIGYGIVELLLEKNFNFRVILTSRNEQLGKNSYNNLLYQYPHWKNYFYYHQLDITKKDSISELINWIKMNFGKIDYLVNNAGFSRGDKVPDENLAVLDVNVYGTINFTEEMISQNMINRKGKIILIGSQMGNLNQLKSPKLKNDFKNATSYLDLFNLCESFRNSYLKGTIDQDGWCYNSYGVSKMIVNTYARVLSYRVEIENNDISVYAVHPGWVRTDGTGNTGPLSIKQGAENAIFLIQLPEGINRQYQGKYFDRFNVSSFG